MNKVLAALIAGLFAVSSFAAASAPEAPKKAEAPAADASAAKKADKKAEKKDDKKAKKADEKASAAK